MFVISSSLNAQVINCPTDSLSILSSSSGEMAGVASRVASAASQCENYLPNQRVDYCTCVSDQASIKNPNSQKMTGLELLGISDMLRSYYNDKIATSDFDELYKRYRRASYAIFYATSDENLSQFIDQEKNHCSLDNMKNFFDEIGNTESGICSQKVLKRLGRFQLSDEERDYERCLSEAKDDHSKISDCNNTHNLTEEKLRESYRKMENESPGDRFSHLAVKSYYRTRVKHFESLFNRFNPDNQVNLEDLPFEQMSAELMRIKKALRENPNIIDTKVEIDRNLNGVSNNNEYLDNFLAS